MNVLLPAHVVETELPLIECGCPDCQETFVLVRYRVAGPTSVIAKGEARFCPWCGKNQERRAGENGTEREKREEWWSENA